VINIKNKLRNNGGDYNDLGKTILESAEADDLLEEYKLRGMVNVAFFFKVKGLFIKALTNILTNFVGDDVENKVKMILDKFSELVKQMASLPEFIDSFVF